MKATDHQPTNPQTPSLSFIVRTWNFYKIRIPQTKIKTGSVTDSITDNYSKDSDLYYNCQWWSRWQILNYIRLWYSDFIKAQALIINALLKTDYQSMGIKTGSVTGWITAIFSKVLNLYWNRLNHSLKVKKTPPLSFIIEAPKIVTDSKNILEANQKTIE